MNGELTRVDILEGSRGGENTLVEQGPRRNHSQKTKSLGIHSLLKGEKLKIEKRGGKRII